MGWRLKGGRQVKRNGGKQAGGVPAAGTGDGYPDKEIVT